jgi:hypothetical protein
MKRIVFGTALLFAVASAIAQQPIPQLSTAEKVALQSLQKTQADAAKDWNDAEQQKLSILREWQVAHSGFHIKYNSANPNDPQNLTVEADPKPVAPVKSAETPKSPEPAKK